MQQSVSRKDRCKLIYLFHSTIKTCVYGVICFIISGILCIQEAHTQEIKGDLFKDKSLEILEKIPQSRNNLKIGPLRIHPSLEISQTYDDNIFESPRREHHDFYETYEPKISLELPFRNISFKFDYGFEIFDYHDNYKIHALDPDRVNRRWGGSTNFNFANGFSIKLSDRVRRITEYGKFTRRINRTIDDPVDGSGGGEEEDEILETFGFNTFTTRRTWTANEASINIDLPDLFKKLDFSLNYTNKDISYKESLFRDSDRNSNILEGTVMIKPTSKIDITTGFKYKHRRFDTRQGSDSSHKTIPFDIVWRFTDKSHFFLSSNYNWRNYDSGNFADFHGYRAQLGYMFHVTEKDNLTIKFDRSLLEQQFQRATAIDLSQSPPVIVDLRTGRNNPQHWTQIGVDFTHQFPRNFSITLSPVWQKRRFRDRQPFIARDGNLVNKHQEIDTIRLEVNGRYTAPRGWLFGEISYKYQDRDNNFPGGDLEKNEAKISVGISL